MAFVSNFNNIASFTTVKLCTLTPHKQYPAIQGKRMTTKYGDSVCMQLQITDTTVAWVFLPKRYTDVCTSEALADINAGHTKVALEYKGVCEKTKAYLVVLHLR